MFVVYKYLFQNCTHLKNFNFKNVYRGPKSFRFASSYEGDGKTKAFIMNDDAEFGLMINGYSQLGFRLNNDVTILGPMAIFPKTVLSWNIKHYRDVNEKSLELFSVLEPKLDILVLGIGDRTNDRDFYKNVISFMRKNRISVEILPTAQAVSTFNFLNSEGRYVAGALIPPEKIQPTDQDVLQSKLKYQKLYEIDD